MRGMGKKLIIGFGLLGKELHEQTAWQYYKGDIYKADFGNQYDTLINCIGYTNTYDNNMGQHWESNLRVTKHLIDICNENNYKYVHISTDYIYSGSKSFASENDVPVHNDCWYSYTKLVADALVQLECNNYLICRGTHKPYPFPYDKAWTNQVGNFDYVDIIAGLIIKLIEKDAKGIYNVGTGLKTMSELAGNNKQKILKGEHVPGDVTMNIDRLKNFLK